MSFNYKKNKLDQLKGFCATVECGNSINDAAIKNCISSTTVSKQISSLEKDLGFLLFDRVKNKLVLNEKGKVYYQEAKKVLLDLDKIYDGKIGIRKVGFWAIKIKNLQIKFQGCKLSISKFFQKMLIKVTIARFLGFIAILALGIFIYLYETNWFFEKRLKKVASPLLGEFVNSGHYRIPKEPKCSFDGMQMHLDLNDLFIDIIDAVDIIIITSSECPSMPMRMNGGKEDDLINNPEIIRCDTERRFRAQKKRHKDEMFILNANKNNKYYNLYKKRDCFHQNIFEDNVRKYPNQLFNIPIKESIISDGYHIILKKGRYYYLIAHVNSLQSHNLDKPQEQSFLFKKLTLNDLMRYDNGTYWKVIKEYNIAID